MNLAVPYLKQPDSALKQTVLYLFRILSLHISSSEIATPETAISVVEVLPAALRVRDSVSLAFV